MVQYLVEEGKTSADLQANDGYTPLFIAAQEGHAEVVQHLVTKKANVVLQSNSGSTALFIAGQEGHAGVVPAKATPPISLSF
jgi:ankyrin repeat protein